MANSRSDDTREVRLEGSGLIIFLVFLAIVIGTSFWAGRWWEARGHDRTAAAIDLGVENEPLIRADAVKEPADIDGSATFFDTVGGAKEAEPDREVATRTRPTDRPATQPQERSKPPTASEGRFFVQVFAGRDEKTAADLVAKLQNNGYQVKVESVSDGSQKLYKVRVGGYSDRAEAEKVGAKLGSSGYPGAWVTEVD